MVQPSDDRPAIMESSSSSVHSFIHSFTSLAWTLVDLLVLRHSARSRDTAKSNAENSVDTPSLKVLLVFKFPERISSFSVFFKDKSSSHFRVTAKLKVQTSQSLPPATHPDPCLRGAHLSMSDIRVTHLPRLTCCGDT